MKHNNGNFSTWTLLLTKWSWKKKLKLWNNVLLVMKRVCVEWQHISLKVLLGCLQSTNIFYQDGKVYIRHLKLVEQGVPHRRTRTASTKIASVVYAIKTYSDRTCWLCWYIIGVGSKDFDLGVKTKKNCHMCTICQISFKKYKRTVHFRNCLQVTNFGCIILISIDATITGSCYTRVLRPR